MNRDHGQLDVLYISTLIRSLVRTELFISVVAIQALSPQITGSYPCTYKNALLVK